MTPGPDLSFLAHEVEDVAISTTTSTLPTKSVKLSTIAHSAGTLVLDASSITTDFDALRFEAAAFEQLRIDNVNIDGNANTNSDTGPKSSPSVTSDESQKQLSTWLISSPYNTPNHYLDLTTLSLPSLVFAKALTALKPVRPDYATASYTSALNFPTILSLVRGFAADEGYTWKEVSFYVVVFRSKLKESSDGDWLYRLDFESHGEACERGGLLKYWFGKVDGERKNLATCFWHSREHARLGGLGPWHKKARAAGRELYDYINFSTHRFTILDGAVDFRFEDWE
ncbi:hypothetical protein P154DRAFT_567421 [Amniculicola lignicola CBS 123094]|uniref:Uncharacterized protein n=1 Tax=Amniculicola lignicola CBS 123094 TaxID=1392246 RepID=A0A6A5VY66_9PLEO|nr:hypothetical protein P154DRAFT_567421 [Amniculicola lignicola CBS 123094]